MGSPNGRADHVSSLDKRLDVLERAGRRARELGLIECILADEPALDRELAEELVPKLFRRVDQLAADGHGLPAIVRILASEYGCDPAAAWADVQAKLERRMSDREQGRRRGRCGGTGHDHRGRADVGRPSRRGHVRGAD